MPAALRPDDHAERIAQARLSLDGLSVGDAFGERFFAPAKQIISLLQDRTMPRPPWAYTDDTEMAIGVVEVLDRHGAVDADDLAKIFAERYRLNPMRGYGAAAHEVLQQIGAGVSWRAAAPALFRGEGSKGNGASMRVAPIGAYFHDDIDRVKAEARASAAITHAHPDGQAGAVAVAVAAAWAARHRDDPRAGKGRGMIEFVLEHTPSGETRDGLERSLALPASTAPVIAAAALGTGANVTASDTVPWSVWCAARHLDDYTECLWTTVSGMGDRDTTCAIAGGIVALATGPGSIPPAWLAARETPR